MAIGGTGQSDSEAAAVLQGEIWNPTTEAWTTVASMGEARMYHSSAVLLPDGRVVVGGGEASGRLRAQVYSPPYLFNGSRPTILVSPGHGRLRHNVRDLESPGGVRDVGRAPAPDGGNACARHEPAIRPAGVHALRNHARRDRSGVRRRGPARGLHARPEELDRRSVGGLVGTYRHGRRTRAGDDRRHGHGCFDLRPDRRGECLDQWTVGHHRRRRSVHPLPTSRPAR